MAQPSQPEHETISSEAIFRLHASGRTALGYQSLQRAQGRVQHTQVWLDYDGLARGGVPKGRDFGAREARDIDLAHTKGSVKCSLHLDALKDCHASIADDQNVDIATVLGVIGTRSKKAHFGIGHARMDGVLKKR